MKYLCEITRKVFFEAAHRLLPLSASHLGVCLQAHFYGAARGIKGPLGFLEKGIFEVEDRRQALTPLHAVSQHYPLPQEGRPLAQPQGLG